MDEYRCTLTDAALKYAADVLHENEKMRNEKMSLIQRWLKSQIHLNANSDANSIIRFLRCCSFDVEDTKSRLTRYYHMRAKTPEWFQNRDSDLTELQELLDLGIYLPLRQRDTQGRVVIIIRAAAHNPQQYTLDDFFKLSTMIFDVAIEQNEDLSVLGCVAVVDLSGMSLAHTFQLTPSFISKAVEFWEHCTPVWIRRMDFINAPMHVNLVLDIFRRFMTPSFQAGVFVHKDQLETLHTVYSPNMLPVEYDGKDGTIQDIVDVWRIRLNKHRDWLLEDEKYKADTSQSEAPGSYTLLNDMW